jgi:hypothetical protein
VVGSQSPERLAAEKWFLAQGLPAVLRRGALLRRVWSRSAPALAGLASIAVNSILIVAITGQHTVDIAGRPDVAESFVLGLVVLAAPGASLAGWLVARIDSPVRRIVAADVALAVIALGAVFVAGSFLVSTTAEKVRPLLFGADAAPGDAAALAGTPFETVPDPADSDPLSVTERANTLFVVAASQLVHVLTVAAMTGTVFFVLGMILVSPSVLDAWTRGAGRLDGELLGMTLPIPDSLIQTTMLLSAITFMYLAAKVVTDTQYRAQFLDPMVADLRTTLLARNRYRASQWADD